MASWIASASPVSTRRRRIVELLGLLSSAVFIQPECMASETALAPGLLLDSTNKILGQYKNSGTPYLLSEIMMSAILAIDQLIDSAVTVHSGGKSPAVSRRGRANSEDLPISAQGCFG